MRFVNYFLIAGAIACLLGTYIIERKVVSAQRDLNNKRYAINESRHTLHLLQAEWALLTSPEHLSKITNNTLAPVAGAQLITADRLTIQPSTVSEQIQDIPLTDVLHDR